MPGPKGGRNEYVNRSQYDAVVDADGFSMPELDGLRLKSNFARVREFSGWSQVQVAELLDLSWTEYLSLEEGRREDVERWGVILCRCAMACQRALPRLLKRERPMEGWPKEMVPTIGETVSLNLDAFEPKLEGDKEKRSDKWNSILGRGNLTKWVEVCAPRTRVSLAEFEAFLAGGCPEAEAVGDLLLRFGNGIGQQRNIFGLWCPPYQDYIPNLNNLAPNEKDLQDAKDLEQAAMKAKEQRDEKRKGEGGVQGQPGRSSAQQGVR